MADSNSPLNLVEAERKEAVRKLAKIYTEGGHALYDDLSRDSAEAYSGQEWDEFIECMTRVHATIGRHISNITAL